MKDSQLFALSKVNSWKFMQTFAQEKLGPSNHDAFYHPADDNSLRAKRKFGRQHVCNSSAVPSISSLLASPGLARHARNITRGLARSHRPSTTARRITSQPTSIRSCSHPPRTVFRYSSQLLLQRIAVFEEEIRNKFRAPRSRERYSIRKLFVRLFDTRKSFPPKTTG